jgi:flagellar protein FliO/FliZ
MQGAMPTKPAGRLKLVDQLWLDAGKTRAVLLRCDGTEHLIIVSPTAAHAVSSAPANQDPTR